MVEVHFPQKYYYLVPHIYVSAFLYICLNFMWLKVVQFPKNGVEIINRKYLYYGYSYLPNYI